MARSFTECLKNIKISKADKALVRQIESEYKADGIEGKTAIHNAIADVLHGTVAEEYSALEKQIADAGGYVDPFSAYVVSKVKEPGVTTPQPDPVAPRTEATSPEAQAKIDELSSSPPPDEAPVEAPADPYGDAAREGSFEYVGRFKNYVKQAETEHGLTPEEIAPFLEPNSKGKVGSPEVKKAVAKALAERERASSTDHLGSTEEQVNLAIQRETELFQAKGDFSQEAELAHAKQMATYFELLDEITTARETAGEISNASKRDNTFRKFIELYPESKKTLSMLRSFYKGEGVTGTEAEAMAVAEYMQRSLAKDFEAIAKKEDKKAGLVRESSSTARAGKLLETGPTTTGIGKNGIQGILRSQGAPHVDHRLEGRSTVDAEASHTTSGIIDELDGEAVVGLDTAQALAHAPRSIDGKMQLSYAPVKFVTDKRIKQGSLTIKKGKAAWYDPITKHFYDDERNMRIARGESSNKPKKGKKVGGKKQIKKAVNRAKQDRDERSIQLAADNEAEAASLTRAQENAAKLAAGRAALSEVKSGMSRAEREEIIRSTSSTYDPYADLNVTDDVGESGILDVIKREVDDMHKTYAEKAADLRREIAKIENPVDPDPARETTIRDAEASAGAIPDNRRLAIMKVAPNNDGTHNMAVLSAKQLARGDSVGALLGRKNPEDFIVGHVDEKVTSGRRKPDLFQPIDAESPNPALIPEKIPNEHKRPAKWEDIKDEPIPPELAALLHGVSSVNIPLKNIKTVRDAHFLIAQMEGENWKLTKKSHQEHAAILAEAYRHMETIAPNGIEFPVTSKEQAMKDLERIYSGSPPEVIAGLKRLISDLNTNSAPLISDQIVGNNRHITASNNPTTMNRIAINLDRSGRIKENGKIIKNGWIKPYSFTLAHELGHWLYFNVLTNKDKAKFWKAGEKYFGTKKGTIDRKKVGDSVLDPRSIAPEINATSNAADSPAELFADQFAMYATQTGRYEIGDQGLWKNVVAYAKAIFDRVIDKKTIDPDLEPLFAKLLIDPKSAAEHAAVKPRATELTPQGKLIEFHWNEINNADKNLHQAIMLDDPEEIIRAADELIFTMLKMTPSAAAQRRLGKTPTGTFGPLKMIHGQIRTKLHQLQNVMRGAKEDSVGSYEQEPSTEFDPELGFSIVKRVIPEGFDNVHNYGDPEKIADAIKDFVYDTSKKMGKKGETGSMVDAIDLTRKTLENAMLRSVPEGGDIDGLLSKSPEAFREGVKNGKPESPITKRYRKRWKTMQHNREVALDRLATEWAGGKGDTLKASGKELPDIKGMPPSKLAKLYKEREGTKEGQSIMHKVLRQSKLATKPVGEPKVNKDQASMLIRSTRDELFAGLRKALEEGKPNATNRFIWEMQRRDFNTLVKRGKGVGKKGTRIKALTPDSHEVSNASHVEIEDSAGGVIDGIPRNARFTIRDALGMITHRNAAIQADARTLAYRMFNLMGRTARSTTEDANLLTMQDVYRLSRSTKASPTATSVMADFSSEEYKMLRSDLRRFTVGLNRGKSDPFDLMHEIGHVLMRTNVISERERATILAGFQNAADPIAEAVRRRKFEGMPQHMVRERQAEEWFVENWAQYLGERVAKGDVFSARLRNRPEDIELRGTLSTLLDRIIEGAAYALNGLIGRDDIKQTFRRLTLFGDMTSTPSRATPSLERRTFVAPELAAGRFANVYESATPATKGRIKSFVGGGVVNEDGDPVKMFIGMPNISMMDDGEVVFRRSGGGNLGPAIYTTDDPTIASEIYAKQGTYGAWKANIESSDLPTAQKIEALQAAYNLTQYRQVDCG